MLRLTVKGTISDVRAALVGHGITAPVITPISHPRVPYCDVEVAEAYLESVVAWFCEPGSAPYPTGTLMFYR